MNREANILIAINTLAAVPNTQTDTQTEIKPYLHFQLT